MKLNAGIEQRLEFVSHLPLGNFDLAHGVPVPDGDCTLLQRLVVHSDLVGRSRLITTPVPAADRPGCVIVHAHAPAAKLLLDLPGGSDKLFSIHKWQYCHLNGCYRRLEPENGTGFTICDILVVGVVQYGV